MPVNLPDDIHLIETHIKRLLRHTRLESIHWINFDQQTITIKTLLHDFVENDFVEFRK